MFESIEIRKAANGYILIVNSEDDSKEFVYDTERKLMRALKMQLGQKISAEDQDWLKSRQQKAPFGAF
jgi:hypothetical protein